MASSSKLNISQKLSINKNLLFCKSFFTKPSFDTFVGVVKSMAKNSSNGSLSRMSDDVRKCISSISYFFNDAKWNANDLRRITQNYLMKGKYTKIAEGDIASIDESAISKKGDSFQLVGDVWDNADKRVNTGYEYLAVAIVSSAKKTKWIFDYLFYSNKDPKFRGKPIYVQRILARLFRVAKSIKTIVLDSGFKNKYTMKFILNNRKDFVIKAEKSMKLWEADFVNKKGHSYDFDKIKKIPGAKHYDLEINGEKGWQITWAKGIVNAWMSEIKIPLTLVVIKNPKFRNPMILITSMEVCDFLGAFGIYEIYLKRWKIEEIFQSIKELGLEKFRVRKLKAIMRYLTIVFVVHSLITWQAAYFKANIAISKLLEEVLRKKRKIKELLVGGMKIFYELYLQNYISLKELVI